LSDHGLETIYAADCTDDEAAGIFENFLAGNPPSEAEIEKYKSNLLLWFGRMDHGKGWVQQYHVGALRNNNLRLYRELGPDVGCDSIGDFELARPLARLLGRLDETDQLAPTVLYNLNPSDNALIASMIGNFQDGRVAGKMQFGSGWWFNDQKDGMERQIEALSQMGSLGCFVGMLTDSRSFLSFPRHEYFRRILCNILGNDMARGLIPDDIDLVGRMVRDISFNNAARYFDFGIGAQA
jgi:glucuronate isomerase